MFCIFLEMSASNSFVAQLYETAGMSHFVHSNFTSVLVRQSSSFNDISVSGDTITDLSYEFEDSEYKWNVNRNLKAREPLLSSGNHYEDDARVLKVVVKKVLNNAYNNQEKLEIDDETIQKAHQMGLEAAYPAFYAMDYK